MAITEEFAWGDGTNDKIYLTCDSMSGDQTVSVSSDQNTGAARTKTITFSASGVTPITLTVNQATGQSIPLWFELESATTEQGYDTGVKLFDTPKSFTILCDATYNNYSWTAWTQGVFGISTGKYFRFGSINQGYDYEKDAQIATANRYSAMIMNNTSSGKMCMSIIARSNASARRRFGIRYDHTTRKIEAYLGTSGTTNEWYTVPGDLTSNNTLKLLIGNASGTINRFKIYGGLLSVNEIVAFNSGS